MLVMVKMERSIEVSEVQAEKAPLPMEVMVDGSVIEASDLQLLKAELLIKVMLDGSVIEVSEVQD